MPWIYHQSTGQLDYNNTSVTQGYSGKIPQRNKPQFQNKINQGPLPRGKYTIGNPFWRPHTGAYSFRLTPDPHNQMFARSEFLIHGPDSTHPRDSSDGCIVVPTYARYRIVVSGDHQLVVVQ